MTQRASRVKRAVITTVVAFLLISLVGIGLAQLYLYYFGPERILFTSTRDGNYEIYDMNSDGSVQCRLTNQLDHGYNASWAPNGRQIAFTSSHDGDDEIYVLNSDGTDLVRLTYSPGLEDNPDWSPDGRQIAFTSHRDGNAEVYVMNADGSAQTRLTNSPAYDIRPVWSPNGKVIAFESTRIEAEPWRSGDGILKIYMMNSDGSNQLLWAQDGRFLAWSPNGREIAYISGRHGYGEIFIRRVDQTLEEQLTKYPEFPDVDGKITWSPDGKQLAFGSYVDNAHGQIYLIDRESKVLTELTYGSDSNGGPDWLRFSTISAWVSWWRLTNHSSRPACGGVKTGLQN